MAKTDPVPGPYPFNARDAHTFFEAVVAAILSTSWGQMGPQNLDAAIDRYRETLQRLRAGGPFNL
jgi:hypothetical protein